MDDLLAHADDQPTIGLLLCETKNNVVAEYSGPGIAAIATRQPAPGQWCS
ncbi:hypothetical protein [Pseudarthrobacter albicanus]|nr:hypothetical protein [Pseudarthrobacter albicanus]